MSVINKLNSIYRNKNEHFIFVDFDFYKKWKYLIKLLVILNRNYIPCTIFRKKYKFLENIVVIGLKWNGKNVKRRTSGFAKEFILENKNLRCIYCNTKLNDNNVTTDHIIPISRGGNNCKLNLTVCCIKCNNERGDMEFYKYLRLKKTKLKNEKIIFI